MNYANDLKDIRGNAALRGRGCDINFVCPHCGEDVAFLGESDKGECFSCEANFSLHYDAKRQESVVITVVPQHW